jgi:hypothetical protein
MKFNIYIFPIRYFSECSGITNTSFRWILFFYASVIGDAEESRVFSNSLLVFARPWKVAMGHSN